MGDQERAAHLLHHAVEAERLEALERVVERIGAQNPHDLLARHRKRRFEGSLDAALPDRLVIPDRAPGDAGGEARIERRTARRVVTAQAYGDDADPFRIDVRALLQEVEARAAGHLVVVAQREAAEADRLAGARPVHDQTRAAA